MSSSKGNPTLPRDPDKILKKYTKLRYSLYGKYKNGFSFIPSKNSLTTYSQSHAEVEFPDIYTQQELMEYIDEQMIRLVMEYDPNGAVDFPGYVYSKLSKRVKGSFMSSHKRDSGREQVGYADDSVLKELEDVPNFDNERYKSLVKDVMDKLINPMDTEIFLNLVNDNKSNYAIYRELRTGDYPDLTKEKFNDHLNYIQKLTVKTIKSYS